MNSQRRVKKAEEAPFAFSGLERIFHERGRLAICTCLVANTSGMSFTDLQRACGLTDGNLNRHLHALAELDIVTIAKRTGSGRPLTLCKITKTGRGRFLAYIDELEAVVRDVQSTASLGERARRSASARLVQS